MRILFGMFCTLVIAKVTDDYTGQFLTSCSLFDACTAAEYCVRKKQAAALAKKAFSGPNNCP